MQSNKTLSLPTPPFLSQDAGTSLLISNFSMQPSMKADMNLNKRAVLEISPRFPPRCPLNADALMALLSAARKPLYPHTRTHTCCFSSEPRARQNVFRHAFNIGEEKGRTEEEDLEAEPDGKVKVGNTRQDPASCAIYSLRTCRWLISD